MPLILTALVMTGSGCYDFNNPVDPEAEDYQGFDSIRPTAAPSAPAALSVGVIGISDREHQAKCNWIDTADNEEGFRVERRSGAEPYIVVATLGANVNQYVDVSLVGDTAYTYRILAYNVLGSSSSAEVTWTTAPVAPSNLTAVPSGSNKIRLDWADNSSNPDITYVIDRSEDGSSWTIEWDSVGPDITTWENTTLPPSTTYWYRVYARSPLTGDSNYAGPVSATSP